MKKVGVLAITLLLLIGSCTSISSVEEYPHLVSASTILPMQTITQTIIATLTVTPTLVKTTPANTMTSDEQKIFVKEFLSDNGECRLPCWWNITPGQTWVEAEMAIQEFGGALESNRPGYDSESTSYGTFITLDIPILGIDNGTVSLEEKHGLVHAWHVSSTGGVKQPYEFRRVWKNYSAQKIIKAYGMPDRVLLRGDDINSSYGGIYSLWLFYDQLGFSILYEALIPKYFFGAPFFRICSETDPLLNIELNMQSPNNTLPLERFDRTFEQIRLGTDIGKILVIRSLQEATGLSNEEIYEAFLQEKDPCLAIPTGIWRLK